MFSQTFPIVDKNDRLGILIMLVGMFFKFMSGFFAEKTHHDKSNK
jgi:hypothetical protein